MRFCSSQQLCRVYSTAVPGLTVLVSDMQGARAPGGSVDCNEGHQGRQGAFLFLSAALSSLQNSCASAESDLLTVHASDVQGAKARTGIQGAATRATRRGKVRFRCSQQPSTVYRTALPVQGAKARTGSQGSQVCLLKCLLECLLENLCCLPRTNASASQGQDTWCAAPNASAGQGQETW